MSSLIPMQMVASGFLAGALMSTRLAPALICSSALSRLVKNPVDSNTTSTPKSFQGNFPGSRSLRIQDSNSQLPRVAFLENSNLVTANDDVLLVVTDLPVEFPVDRIPFQQMRERVGVGQIIDRADAFNVAL